MEHLSKKRKYDYYIAGCAHNLAPVLTHVAILSCNDTDILSIPECIPFQGEWGKNEHVSIMEDEIKHELPKSVHIIYLSIIEQKFYIINEKINTNINESWDTKDKTTGDFIYNKIIVGMSPYGNIAIWLSGHKKSTIIFETKGKEIYLTLNQFLPNSNFASINELCNFFIENNSTVKEYLKRKGIPSSLFFDRYMHQYNYRYILLHENWNYNEGIWSKYNEEIILKCDYIEESLIDGTFDKLHDDGLLKYHKAGKPKKLAIKWHIKKSEYTAYFWFEDEKICSIFERFYGAHPDTKSDFIIRIDAEKKKYELALFRQGLKEPQIITEDAYQLLVFKNKFEDYQSDNYNQEHGAWIW